MSRRVIAGPEVESFYHLSGHALDQKLCRGLGCFAARGLNPDRWSEAVAQWPQVYCLGKCYSAPSSADEDPQPLIEIHCDEPIVLAGVPGAEAKPLRDYGGYRALEKALSAPPEHVLLQIEESQLRGRGGAGFPAGKKWRAVASEPGPHKFVVANADEGDHGSYIDRFIMENAPHRLLEALCIAAYAVGARKGYIYLRKEYPKAHVSLLQAMQETTLPIEIDIVVGQGSYVCGEETSLLNSIEHRRPEVRSRPPFPTQAGLFGAPTLVNNVETLASIPWIVLNGGGAYAAKGSSNSRGTKAVSLSSLFKRPGLYEIEFGVPLRTILYELGGGLKTGDIKAVIVGGPLTGVIRPEEFDTPFAFEEMGSIGAAVGHGGIVAFDHNTNMVDMLAHVFVFGATESCGKCTPCRIGSRRAQELFAAMSGGKKLSQAEQGELSDVLQAMQLSSLCGHGTGLAEVAQSIMRKFPEEVAACLAQSSTVDR